MLKSLLKRCQAYFLSNAQSHAAPTLSHQEWLVLNNFLQECLHSRKEPVNCRGILFEDERFSHEELVQQVLKLSNRKPTADAIYTKNELQKLVQEVSLHLAAKN